MNIKKITAIIVFSMPVVFPLVAVWLGDYIISASLNKPFQFHEELGPRIGQTIIASFPFLVVALIATFVFKENPAPKKISGVIGAAISVFSIELLLWGTLYYSAFTYSGGGANIGLGILILFSPIIVSVLAWPGYLIGQMIYENKKAGK